MPSKLLNVCLHSVVAKNAISLELNDSLIYLDIFMLSISIDTN